MATVQLPIRSRVVGTLSCQQNSYLRSLEAEVISCIPYSPPNGEQAASKAKVKKSSAPASKEKQVAAKPTWLIEFNDSVLFPEGGGQPTDYGTLVPLSESAKEPIKVDFIQRQGLHCVVHSPQPLTVGESVRQEVDFQRRWDLMQQHTGQHLLTAVMNTYENLETLGWGMGADGDMSYVDLPRKPTEEELQVIQKKVNEIIQQNIKITVETPDNANVDKLPDDYDKEGGVIRVVKIGDLDNNTCCGTHLQQTAHIAVLLLGPNQPNSGGRCRQFFIAGNRAIQLATSSLQSVRSISRLLSSGTGSEELINNVGRLQESTATLKKKETKLLAEIAKYETDRVKLALQNGKSAFVHRPEPGMDFINIVAASVKDDIKEGSTVILASGEGDKGGAVLIIGKKDAVDSSATKIKEAFPSVKGGGKGERWQGKMSEWKAGELEKLQKMVEV